ncbi:MAG: type II toxin-antitoxin system VapC family toxin [Thermoproteales archaeon]|nr:type II toxin-antitoxin system VapC family toxin [Thermoproteales archaeon]
MRRKRCSLATTAVNIFELSWGAHKLGGGRIRDVERLASRLLVLGLTVREALKAGEEAYLESLGLAIDVRDLLIGVIARENGYAIATGNVEHFTRIRGLRVIRYER